MALSKLQRDLIANALEIAQDELSELQTEYGVSDIALKHNGRLKRTKGRISYSVFGLYGVPEDYLLELATDTLLNFPEAAIREVVRHEYAHIIEHQLYDTFSHSKEWREIADMVGGIYPQAGASVSQRVASYGPLPGKENG